MSAAFSSPTRILSEDDYAALAMAIAPELKPGDCIALEGDLGAGKTSFARALIRIMSHNPEEDVPSPTFTLVQQYKLPNPPGTMVWHFDLYRLDNPEDVIELDIDDALETGISVIEWPDKMGSYLPSDALHITFHHLPDGMGRRLSFQGAGTWLNRLKTRLQPWLSDEYHHE